MPDPGAKTGHQLGLVVFGRNIDGEEKILAIGEAKSNAIVGETQLVRLERIRDLPAYRDKRASERTKLLLFTGNDFTSELRLSTETVMTSNLSTSNVSTTASDSLGPAITANHTVYYTTMAASARVQP